MNAPGLQSLDLLAGSLSLQAPVRVGAGNSALLAVVGANQINYESLAATALGRAVPATVIDIGVAGGLQANQIYLVSTEAGAGVNLRGAVQAGSGGFTLDAAGNLMFGGSHQSGGALVLSGKTVSGGGKLESTGMTLLQAQESLQATNLEAKTGDLMLAAGGDLKLTGGALQSSGDLRLSANGKLEALAVGMQAGNDALLSSRGDLVLGVTASRSDRTDGAGIRTEETRYNRSSVTATGGSVALQSTNGVVVVDGSRRDAGKSIAVQGLGVALQARKDMVKTTSTNGNTTTSPSSEILVGTSLYAKDDIAMLAHGTGTDQGNLLLAGARVESNSGHVSLLAAKNLDVVHDITTDRTWERFYHFKRKWYGGKEVTEIISSTMDETVNPSEVSGRSVSMGAGAELTVVGSALFADGAVGLHADGDLSLLSTSEAHYAYESRYTKKSGIFSNGGLSITIGSKSKTEIAEQQEVRQASSSISSLAGDILATAGNQYLQLSSDLVAPQGDIHVSARNIAIQSNNNTRSVLNIVRERQSGITLSASHPLISAALTLKEMDRIRKRTENGRYQALALLTSGLTVYNQFQDFEKQKNEAPNQAPQGFTFSLSLGSTRSDYESLSGTTTPAESALNAGRDLSLTATGGGDTTLADSGDISLAGARLSASRNLSLNAARDITLAAAIGTNTERTKQTSSSASIGLSYTIGGTQSGLHFNIAASRSNAWSNGWGTTYFNSEAIAGEKLSISSGRHTTLSGAKASGKSLLARVGTTGSGNLTLTSPIDEQHYKAREESFGFNVSIPIPGLGMGGSFSVNASKLELLGEFESVRQQSALVAGTGGFDIAVNGHTHLKGAAISSEAAAASLNRFITQTLTHEDIVNRDRVSGKSSSIGISTTGTDVKGASVGFARVDTNSTSDTRSSIAPGTLTVTRPDLQASAASTHKAGQREPLETRRTSLQAELNRLLLNEPPRCIGCNPLSAPIDPLGAPETSAGMGQAELAEPGQHDAAAMVGGTNPAWISWNSAVQALRSQINGLQTRISAIDAQVLKGPDSSLNRSPSPLHQPLLQTFDAAKATRELKDGTAVTAAFGKAAYKAAGDLAETNQRDAQKQCTAGSTAACDDAKHWGEGGRYRVALHGLIGALGHGQAGAIANLTASSATPYLVQLAKDAGFAQGTLAHNLLVAAAATAVGAGAGGTAGAAAAFNADANNRQLHLIETRWIKANARSLALHLSAITGRSVSETEAVYWAGLAGGALVDQAAYNAAVSQLPGLSTAEETRLYVEAKRYITANASGSFVDQHGKNQRLFVAAPGDRFNTFMYADLRNNSEYREHMWELAGQNLRPDNPSASELALYGQRQTLLLQQTGKDLALFAVTGGATVGAVRLLNRLSPPRGAAGPVAQTVDLDSLDSLVKEHSRAGGGGHTGVDLTREAALKAISETQPQGTRAVVVGAGVEGPDVRFVRVSDGQQVETVQVKTASSPRAFEKSIQNELGKDLGNGGSRVVVVMYPNEADAGQLLGKLMAFDTSKVAGRSVLVLSPTGRVIIPLQPWPRKPD